MTEEAFKKIINALAIISVVVGGAGCILCLPAAFTSNLNFITTTGIYFIAGGIMIVGGLITLAVMVQTTK